MAKDLTSVFVSDTARRIALSLNDPYAYFNACERYGIPPEDTELYEQGRELAGVRIPDSQLPRSPVKSVRRDSNKYKIFLQKTRALGINVDDFLAHPLNKRQIFRDCFPHQYQAQRLDEADNTKFGAVYKKLVEHAERVARIPRQ